MTRIVPKRELALWVAIVAAMVAGAVALAVVMANTPARAASAPAKRAANKHVVQKRDNWASIRYYTAPNATSGNVGSHIESYTVSIATDYLYWPDGKGVDKVAVEGGEVCYRRNSGSGVLFQGVNSNPYYRDDLYVVNPGAIEVDNDGTGNNCEPFNIPTSERRWFKNSRNPIWHATGKLRIKWGPDQNWDYKWAGIGTKPFKPQDDDPQSPWFYCECDYPGQ